MTDTHYLLLTEQDRDDIAGIKEHIDASYSQECADRLASALIAARAENKRKDEVIAGLRAVVQEVAERPTVSETPGVHADEFTDLEDALTLQARALLQSEKGGAG